MISPQDIGITLQKLEAIHDIVVLMAVEAGSRAYGLSSENSDYDVRFIYVHKRDWYLSISLEEQVDHIGLSTLDGLDVLGWDLRKALRLFWKSNSSFVEWLQSDVIYIEKTHFRAQSQRLLADVYSIEKGMHHYRSLAARNLKKVSADTPDPKVILSSLRPLLTALWISKYRQPAPLRFNTLLSALKIDPELQSDIENLVESRSLGSKPLDKSKFARLYTYIESTLSAPELIHIQKNSRDDISDLLSGLFRQTLSEAWPLDLS